MASDARSNGMSLSPEVPLLSTCKDLQSNSDVFGCDVRPNAICIRYSGKKTANRPYLTHNTSVANFARIINILIYEFLAFSYNYILDTFTESYIL